MSSSNRNYTQYNPEATKSKYYQYALEAMIAINQRFPLGAINRVDVVEEFKLPQQEVLNMLKTCSTWGKECNNNHSPNILANVTEKVAIFDINRQLQKINILEDPSPNNIGPRSN